MNYVFDVDGTLTPSRGIIDLEFKIFFNAFCLTNNVYLVTGSDREKTIEQIGEGTYNLCKRVYNCTGNAVYQKDKLLYQSKFKISDQLKSYLNDLLEQNPYPTKTGIHIEERIGLCNFSIVGRNATKLQREDYIKYDTITRDRSTIVNLINKNFSEVEAAAGGETGVDIYEKGKDKSQIVEFVRPFTFFGDAIYPGGNDYSIALKADNYYHVKSWTDTYEILKGITNE